MIAQHPVLGVGFGQFFHLSKRFTLPVEGTVARYMKRAQMAHNEYLQHIAELGFPAALLLFALLGYRSTQLGKRAQSAWPDFRWFHEAALLTAAGVGTHALVDNCWTIPVTASGLVVLALADPLPLRKKMAPHRWSKPQLAFAGAAIAIVYVVAIAHSRHRACTTTMKATRHTIVTTSRPPSATISAAIAVFRTHPLFLDNLGMVYLQQFTENGRSEAARIRKEVFPPCYRGESSVAGSTRPYGNGADALSEREIRSTIGIFTSKSFKSTRSFSRSIRLFRSLERISPARTTVSDSLITPCWSCKRQSNTNPTTSRDIFRCRTWYTERGDAVAGQRYMATAMDIVNRYRNFKPTRTLRRHPARTSSRIRGLRWPGQSGETLSRQLLAVIALASDVSGCRWSWLFPSFLQRPMKSSTCRPVTRIGQRAISA